MIHRLVILALVCILSSLAHVCAQSNQGRQFAFLVACGEYDKTQVKPVPFAVAEMKLFRQVLVDSGVSDKNIIFLHDKTDEPRRFLPTRENVLAQFKLLIERLRPDDSLVVVLSGHGVQYKGDKFGYFCPLDAELGADKKHKLLAMEGEDGLLTLLDQGTARRKLFIVNACRNNPVSSLNLAKERLELRDEYNEEPPKGTVLLLSCKQNQFSWYYDEKEEKHPERRNRSLFMWHLTEAWKGSYAQSEKVTIDHLVAAVAERVEADAPRDFNRNQFPIVKRNFQGDWILARVAPASAKPPERKPAEEPKLLGGSWSGTYHYPASANKSSVSFNLDMTQDGRKIKAATAEYNTFWPTNPKISRNEPILYANCKGSFDETTRRVNFMKTYDGTGGADGSVEYNGYLSRDGTKIEGSWTIREIGRADFSGTFTLEKKAAEK